ncbi:uncharacterized protein LOC106079767 isoform X2 [Biomphalaria glabrata]|uniref:Uncharacterized protein LOC106079767 isoform X2 n=1 Tax=Biomphalaria glabrata TaxID=6526 RepID=A0A9W2YU03_BIOGL|nr:uncharacterized protein LOC106079767 isoform X2 [Biomphalaria glabrata]
MATTCGSFQLDLLLTTGDEAKTMKLIWILLSCALLVEMVESAPPKAPSKRIVKPARDSVVSLGSYEADAPLHEDRYIIGFERDVEE